MSNLETDPRRSRLMSRIRQKDTGPERTVRHLLTSLGIRYRTDARDLPGTPDIVNRTKAWAIFVHGCYWHAHQGCSRWTIPKRNRLFWEAKFAANRQRDRLRQAQLEWLGYRVLVIWECELQDETSLTSRILEFVDGGNSRTPACSVEETAARYQVSPTARISYRYGKSRRRALRTVDWGTHRTQCQLGVSPLTFDTMCPELAYEQAWLRRTQPPSPTAPSRVIRCADIFSGCGGLSLGISEACRAAGYGFESSLGLDSDETATAIFVRNFRPRLTRCTDIRNVFPGALGSPAEFSEARLGTELKSVDFLVAGPPCQGHSNLNNHTRRDDERNDLYDRTARFAELFRPTHILIENVASVVLDQRGAMQATATHLQWLGYFLDQGVIDLVRFGVPQSRKRHVLVASSAAQPSLQRFLGRHQSEHLRTLQWAIDDLQDEPPRSVFSSPASLSAENRRRIDWLFDNDRHDLPNEQRPRCHQTEHKYLSMYGRLYWDRPANTVTTGFSSPGQGRYVHPTRRRTLTPHEAARLQLFPDWFDFSPAGTRKALSQMIGNAVPMKLSFVLGLELLALDR